MTTRACKAVLFDLDGTLYDRDRLAAAQLLAHFRETYDRYCYLTDDVRETLAELRKRQLKLGVITNGSSVMQRRKLAGLGLEQAFDVVVVSEEEGVRKPDAEIFRRALNRLDVAAREAVFVGDHPVADVDGARNAGLLAVWMFVPYWSPPVAPDSPVINVLSELLPIVDGDWPAVEHRFEP